MRKYIVSGEEQQSSKTSRVGDSTGCVPRLHLRRPEQKTKNQRRFPFFSSYSQSS